MMVAVQAVQMSQEEAHKERHKKEAFHKFQVVLVVRHMYKVAEGVEPHQ
jgi:hypothetical protein